MDAVALSRFNDVQAALHTPDVMICGAGDDFSNVWNTPGEPNLITVDGASHCRLCSHLARPMLRKHLEQERDMLEAPITEKTCQVAEGATFDGVTHIAKHLPLAAIPFLVGLLENGRQNMPRWVTTISNMVGPISPKFVENLVTFLVSRRYMTLGRPGEALGGLLGARTVRGRRTGNDHGRRGSCQSRQFRAAKPGNDYQRQVQPAPRSHDQPRPV